jgi:hypothetical protein
LEALRKGYEGSLSQMDPLQEFQGVRKLLGERGLAPNEAVDYLLEEAIHRFGYAAGDVFRAVFMPAEVTRRHESALVVSYTDLKDAVFALLNNQIGYSNTIPHRILAMNVVDPDGPLTVDFKSDWIAKSIVQRLVAAEEENEILKQISFLRHIPKANQMIGHFFEAACLAKISTGGSWPLLPLINMPSIDTSVRCASESSACSSPPLTSSNI